MLRTSPSPWIWRLLVPLGTSLGLATVSGPDRPESMEATASAHRVAAPDPTFEKVVRPLIARYCVPCHGEERQRGDVRLDQLDPDLVEGPDRELFELALELIESEEMPSRKAEEQPTGEEREVLVDWIRSALIAADEELERGPALRRLSRDQYTNALQELLGVGIDFGRRLPPDARSEAGFSSDGEALSTSALRIESFRSIARMALEEALVDGLRPDPLQLRFEFGRGIGMGEGNRRTGGYQSVPLDPNHFRISEPQAEGRGLLSTTDRQRMTVGLRGSSLDRFHVVDDGLVLYSALPRREVAPMSWQGPSPNLKLELQRILPDRGDFVLRVEASRGVLAEGGRELLLAASALEEGAGPTVSLDFEPDSDALGAQETQMGDWHLLGPIRTQSGDEATRTRYVPDGLLDFEAIGDDGERLWARAPKLDGRVRRYPEHVGAVMLGRVIDAPSPRSMELSIGSDDAVFVWLNGESVLEADVRRGVSADQNRVSLDLRAGRNDLLLKVVNHGGGFGSYVNVLHDGTRLAEEPVGVVADRDGTIVVHVDRVESAENLILDAGVLRAEELPEESSAQFRQALGAGLWQFDLVHPVPDENAMASIRLQIDDMRVDLRPEFDETARSAGFAVTPIGVARLQEGLHDILLGGPFFTGFSHLVMTPLPDDHPLAQRLDAEDAARSAELVPELRAFIGTRTDDGMDYRCFGELHKVDTAIGNYEQYEFHGRLEDLPIPEPDTGDTEILSGYCVLGVWNHHLVKSPDQSGPPLLIHSMEVVTSEFEQWPPQTHRRIVGDTEVYGLSPDQEVETVRGILGRFLPRAFRRPVGEGEVERYVEFWRNESERSGRFVPSLRETLAAVLSSPSFLYMLEQQESDRIDEYALANRLSFFLWDGAPDARLTELAASGRLRESLGGEVDRLLEHENAERFFRRFVHEWLRMDRFDGITIDPGHFPDFTRFVKEDMAEEAWRFVRHQLLANRSVFDLIESDTAMLNQNLAEFYGVLGVRGSEFRPVTVTPESGRGGLLGHGAFLAGHSDGQEPHPIKRAIFVKERLLGQKTPPPPPNVPDLDPTIEGFDEMTLKERIEQHRDNPSCMECHAGFDPYGIALESFDAVGRMQPRRKGRPVDAVTVLPDGTEVDGVAGLRAYLVGPGADRFARAFTRTLFGYALGREPGPADEAEVDQIVDNARSEGLGLRSLVHSLVQSESFRDR
ncbi:MAG: DUF1592 domain-containing protein [Planctomycetota bacterium]